jgi:hypothetical protein
MAQSTASRLNVVAVLERQQLMRMPASSWMWWTTLFVLLMTLLWAHFSIYAGFPHQPHNPPLTLISWVILLVFDCKVR